MPSPDEPLKPTPFEAIQPAPTATPPAAGDHRQPPRSPWLAISLGSLAALALAVFFWLPGQVGKSPADTANAPLALPQQAQAPVATQEASPASPAAAPGTQDGDVAPFEQALQARLRKTSQTVLEPLLDLQFTLEEQGVTSWAPTEFQAALDTAKTGDELYRKREFEAATSQYQQALAALEALRDSIPGRIKTLLAEADAAIEELDQQRALDKLDTVDLLEADSGHAAQLRQRAGQIPQLHELFVGAAAAESAGELAAARDALKVAVGLDPQHQRAQQELLRLSEALEEELFRDAMSRGYTALANNQLAQARAAFGTANTLRPDSPEAQDALLQAGEANTGARLAELERQGRRLEQQEKWRQAVRAYETAQGLDNAVLFAAEGLARSHPRAQLDSQLSAILDAPGRLSNPAVAGETASLLHRARGVTPRGPVLATQIAQVENARQLANTPVPVTLLSDQQTDVVVYKIARLGRFEEHLLELRPGTYTAVGSRIGYRDVRESFTIEPGAQPIAITIACTEPI